MKMMMTWKSKQPSWRIQWRNWRCQQMAHGHGGLLHPVWGKISWCSKNSGFPQQDLQRMRKSLCWGLAHQAQRRTHCKCRQDLDPDQESLQTPMMQQCKLESLLLHSIKTWKTPQDSTNTSPSPFSQSTLESLTIMPYQNGSSEDSTHRLWCNSLSQEQSRPPPLWRNFTQRPPRLREVTSTSHCSEEDPNHPMEEVVITTTPMLWMWIASHYPQSNKLATCAKIAASYPIRKAVLLGIILVTIRIVQQIKR